MWSNQQVNDDVRARVTGYQSITTVQEVLEIQGALKADLAPLTDVTNPVRTFNKLYLGVTKEVQRRLGLLPGDPEKFADEDFMIHLDVEFAKLYFKALLDWVDDTRSTEADFEADPGRPPGPARAWRLLFVESRNGARHSELEGALLGVNAHINHDLSLAIVNAHLSLEPLTPAPDFAVRKADFDKINDIFRDQIKTLWPALIDALDDKFGWIWQAVDTLAGQLDEWVMLQVIVFSRDQAWHRAMAYLATAQSSMLEDGKLSAALAAAILDLQVFGLDLASLSWSDIVESLLALVSSAIGRTMIYRSSIPGQPVRLPVHELVAFLTTDGLIERLEGQSDDDVPNRDALIEKLTSLRAVFGDNGQLTLG